MPDLVACASCGAGNPPAATWCSQCHAPFDDGPVAGASAPSGWACPTCGRRNTITAVACPGCGTSLFDSTARRRASPIDALRAARLFPGGGLMVRGSVLAGLLVAGPALLAAIAAILLVADAPAFSLVLAVAITGLWLASYHETARANAGAPGPSVLTPRVLSFLSGGTVALAFVFLVAGLKGR